jgi:Xaa-Pro dipeptidase
MQQPNLDRLNSLLRAQRFDAALLTSPWTLTWLTGYAPSVQTGPSPFEGGPMLGWWREGELTLVCSDGECGAARATGAGVVEYAGYTYETPLTVVERQAQALETVLSEGSGRNLVLGVEYRFLPAVLQHVIRERLPDATLVPVDRELEPLRAVKTPEEIVKMRAVLSLCDRAQAEVRDLIQPGISEIALWGQLKARLEVAAGGRLPVQGDLAGGVRTAEMGGWAGPYILQESDPLLADIVPRLNGYWGDICGTHFAGAPKPELANVYRAVRDVLWRAMDTVRPGRSAKELDGVMRAAVEDAGYPAYPHHSGHGIGASAHEEPRIVPYNGTLLEQGMVIALEPAVYLPGVGGVRLENVVLVTESGCELLTQHLAD